MAVQTNNHHMSCTVLYGDGPRELRNWCRPRPPRRVTGLTHGPIPPSRDTTPPPHATRPTPHRDRPATAPRVVCARSARSWRRPHRSRRVRRRSRKSRFRPPLCLTRSICHNPTPNVTEPSTQLPEPSTQLPDHRQYCLCWDNQPNRQTQPFSVAKSTVSRQRKAFADGGRRKVRRQPSQARLPGGGPNADGDRRRTRPLPGSVSSISGVYLVARSLRSRCLSRCARTIRYYRWF